MNKPDDGGPVFDGFSKTVMIAQLQKIRLAVEAGDIPATHRLLVEMADCIRDSKSLRQWYKGQALATLADWPIGQSLPPASRTTTEWVPAQAKLAGQLADAMLAEDKAHAEAGGSDG